MTELEAIGLYLQKVNLGRRLLRRGESVKYTQKMVDRVSNYTHLCRFYKNCEDCPIGDRRLCYDYGEKGDDYTEEELYSTFEIMKFFLEIREEELIGDEKS